MTRLFYLLLLFGPLRLAAQGGMWLPLYLEKYNEKEMQALGCRLEADDLYDPVNPSAKDAVCIFGGGCTGGMISPEGLLLTNHHCGFGQIQSHSSVENNFVDNGFWAMSRQEELPCPGLSATFVVRMEEVTIQALAGVTEAMAEADREAQIEQNLADIRRNAKKEKWQEVQIRPFYKGNQYFLFVVEVFEDVRMVGAPPASIGKFGSDTDNWVWPRHTGDFALFRVYADSANRPAGYRPENVPYRPRHFFPVSLSGVEEGDFMMVFGFPGRTNEYLPAAAVRQIAETLDPARVAIRDKALKVMDGFMRSDLDIKIAYIARYASIANAWKKWQGEMLGLKTYGAMDKKAAFEKEYERRLQNNPTLHARYKNILPRLNTLYAQQEESAFVRDYFFEVFVRNTQILNQVASLNRWLNTRDNTEAFASRIPQVKQQLTAFYKDYRPQVDQAVFAELVGLYAQNVPAPYGAETLSTMAESHGGYGGLATYVFTNSALADETRMMALLERAPSEVSSALEADPAVVLWRKVFEKYQTLAEGKFNEIQSNIDLLERQYMEAQMALFPEKRFFPDANGTLRLTYGRHNGYTPRDAVRYEPVTYLEGVMEKYIPGDYEFDVPQRLIDLHQRKDYGRYADKNGKMPVAILGTNHTTGGNSGSPALDAYGNLIGLNFDRVWEGTMSDLNYDPAICRNIMVDARYILFIIDKYAGAGHLLQEMQLVTQQKKRKKRK